MSSMSDLNDSSSIQEIEENGDSDTKMIVDQDRKVFLGNLNWDVSETVIPTQLTYSGEPMDTDEGLLTQLEPNRQINQSMDGMGEAVVFDDVGNEVSITATDDKAAALTVPVPTSKVVRKPKLALTPNKTKPIQPNQGSVLIPISNQASGLAQFITSIRPPAMPGSQAKVRPAVATRVVPVKKPLAIAPAPSPVTSGMVTKVLMTTTGQQLVISSPIKSGQDSQKTSTITVGGTNAGIGQQGTQQIVFISPIKPSTPNKLVQVRPKPPAGTATVEISNVSQQKGDVKPLQIIRLVPSSANSLNTTAATSKTVTINKLPSVSSFAPNYSKAQTAVTSSSVGTQKVLIPASAIKAAGGTITPSSSALVQSSSNTIQSAFITNSGGAPVIMLPAHFLQGQGQQVTSVNQIQVKASEASNATVKHVTFSNAPSLSGTTQRTSFVPIAPSPLGSQPALPASQILAGLSGSKTTQNGSKSDGDANRPRKPCNCTKSQCLKLYCDCFANGEFCHSCNCINCANNLEHEEDRQKAIRQCLERNPHAFHPKIGKGRGDVTERRHTKGCNCRRSGCLKNYCECYEAKILCSDLCKCIGCKNYEDSYERKTLMHLADAAEVRSAQQSVASKAKLWGTDFTAKLPIRLTNDKMDRLNCSFITSDVLEATCQCLLATAEDGERLKVSYTNIEERILEEFGSCLTKIIETASKARK